ncbi:cytosolic phospholipase A2 zeta isoform X1 [Electrophorus electricus]|uniref:cytosolic phospholipase A2 zeta isoform X1 n=1 Tax=Electrophorus electricus TaxID=8005 RepID=UPI0015D0BFF2|nr:cytosolic phospholipase A2 zeta isoform X1 [Electrophorus electricus]
MKELMSHWKLSVKVLKGKFHHSHDILSESDLYVTLHLPTASACTLRTTCIPNSSTPEWNETFHFRVHSQVKNILEINVYDKDLIQDDLCTTILFDIASLKPGQKETKVFFTNEKTKDELWVEFEITESSEPPGQYHSNGVLVTAPLSTLEVKLDALLPSADELVLKLKGAYKEEQVISKSSSILQTLRYYINRDLATEIGLLSSCSHDKEEHEEAPSQRLAPVTPFSSSHELTVSLPVDKNTVDLHLKTVDSSEEELQVRLDFDIPAAEKAFLVKRKEVSSRALQRVLKLNAPPHPSRVPTVAVVCSGGSTRAMTCMYGSLRGLQRLDLLDTVSYITAVSGSTWTTASLYRDPCWSRTEMDKAMASVQNELLKSAARLFFPQQLRYYHSELEQRESEGHDVSLIDLWGLAIEQLIYGKKYTGTLTDQQRAVSEGQNPLPIYTAVNIKNTDDIMVAEWCEFTPFEVGFPKYGIFVPAENFGSEYFLGHLIKKLPETRISFLLGIWSSVFSANLTELWSSVTGILPSWKPWLGQQVVNTAEPDHASTLDTRRVSPDVTVLSSFLTGRPVISKVFNFLRGFFLHNNYSQHATFTTWNDKHPDSFPNKLTPVDSTLCLVDSGFAINSSFPPILRAHRRADIILSFNYSWQHDHFKVLRQTQQYCSDHSVPFPRINFDGVASEPQREVYVFEDQENLHAPIVIHFPLVNVSFRQYKAPGLRRRGEKELKEGDVDVSTRASPYVTKHLTYTPEDFRRLANLTTYNILNNKTAIIQALQRALHRGEE